MSRALEMMGRAISDTANTLWSLLSGITWNPLQWDPLTWMLLVAVLVLALLLALAGRGERPLRATRPDILISLGEISVLELAEEGEPPSIVNELRVTVSNMGSFPVQLLELAVTTDQMSLPVTAELGELVRPNASLRFETRLDPIVGEAGLLHLYLYAPKTQKRHFRLTAPFDWEPWDRRYKISPLDQKVRPSRRLPSAGTRRRREKEWRERQAAERELLEPEPRPVVVEEIVEPELEPAEKTPEGRRVEFPDEF